MALLDLVTTITHEIRYTEELIQNILKISETRLAAMRERFNRAVQEENETTIQIVDELKALKLKLATLIETPTSAPVLKEAEVVPINEKKEKRNG